jgi:hypothetical protein
VRKRKTEIKIVEKKQVKKDVSQTEEKYGKRRLVEADTTGGAWELDYPNKLASSSEA